MIVITGAAGFIGSALVTQLNAEGRSDLVLIDDFSTPMRQRNLAWKHFQETIDRSLSKEWVAQHEASIEAVFHLGAKSGYFHENWVQVAEQYFLDSQYWWNICVKNQIPFIYATTGATYGANETNFSDSKEATLALQPKHPYAQMKHRFDTWALQETKSPPFWAGLKMFNVYGPNEYHKHKNASMQYKAYNEILSYGSLQLFRSYNAAYADGGQIRDFVYVKDVVKVMSYLYQNRGENGIYNIGTGVGHSFKEMADICFRVLGISPVITFAEMPESIREAFPYYAKADISKLRANGYQPAMKSLEEGIRDYYEKFLMRGDFY